MDGQLRFPIPNELIGVVDRSIARLSYLYPEHQFELIESHIVVSSNRVFDSEKFTEIKKEIYYQLYRERVFQETLPIKKWLYGDD